MAVTYSISLPNPQQARGADAAFSFTANGAEAFAEQLQRALSDPAWFERWRNAQAEPDEVDPALGATDADAKVSGSQADLRINLLATTTLPGEIVRHRMDLLAGKGWELRNVR
ncbi:hypothetical protein [Xanthomonas massiliensis]|jgi:hypothetical protein|uniref:hypothetical protein n=1 Tax=Xanthomonas massiliensis TaxID=1720302 RepID=UPI0008244768|nr:hypothetical protein [Xanthomonas massiliensis]